MFKSSESEQEEQRSYKELCNELNKIDQEFSDDIQYQEPTNDHNEQYTINDNNPNNLDNNEENNITNNNNESHTDDQQVTNIPENIRYI